MFNSYTLYYNCMVFLTHINFDLAILEAKHYYIITLYTGVRIVQLSSTGRNIPNEV